MANVPMEMRELWSKFFELLVHLTSVVIDLAFFCIWVWVNYWADQFVTELKLSPIGMIEFRVLQVLFAIVLVIPVAFYVYRDIMRMWYRAKKSVAQEKAKP